MLAWSWNLLAESMLKQSVYSLYSIPQFQAITLMRRPNGLRISRAPARITSIDREGGFQNSNDLDRPGRGVGWMRLLGRCLIYAFV